METKSAHKFSLISSANATTLVPATVIPYQQLYGVNVNADMTIAQLVNGNTAIASDLGINAKVNNGVAAIKILKGKVADGAVTANLNVNAQSQSVVVNADIRK